MKKKHFFSVEFINVVYDFSDCISTNDHASHIREHRDFVVSNHDGLGTLSHPMVMKLSVLIPDSRHAFQFLKVFDIIKIKILNPKVEPKHILEIEHLLLKVDSGILQLLAATQTEVEVWKKILSFPNLYDPEEENKTPPIHEYFSFLKARVKLPVPETKIKVTVPPTVVVENESKIQYILFDLKGNLFLGKLNGNKWSNYC